MNYKKFGILFIITFIISIILFSLTIIIIDPYFHYHKPIKNINYKLDVDYQRYINDGIVKHFDYDSIITGTSMTRNFKTSEFDQLFNANSIKVPLLGAYYKEINELLNNAFNNNKNIKYVIRSVDYINFYNNKDDYAYDVSYYPRYLYNYNIFDDVKYILNKDNLINSISYLKNKHSTTFDEYSNWGNKYKFGKEEVSKKYFRVDKVDKIKNISDVDRKILRDNINQNIISLIKENHNTEFYLFYPPYSIYQWDKYNQSGELNKYLEGEMIITKMLLEYDNVHIFSFLNEYDIIINLENYMDPIHYSEEINTIILKSMKNNKNRITKENYLKYYNEIIKYYNNYDYDSLFDK